MVLLQKEVTYEGYQQYQAHKDAPPPLTNAEEEMKLMDETEVTKSLHLVVGCIQDFLFRNLL